MNNGPTVFCTSTMNSAECYGPQCLDQKQNLYLYRNQIFFEFSRLCINLFIFYKNDTFYRGNTLDSVKSLMCYPLSVRTIHDSFGSFRTLFDLNMIINHCGMLCRVNSKLQFCAWSQTFLTICGFFFVGTVLNTVFSSHLIG